MPPERTYRALLIGTGTHTAPDNRPMNLLGPANDVRAVADALCDASWGIHMAEDVTVLTDPTREDMARSVERFFSQAGDGDQLFFFYSGHGLQQEYERLYLCASDTATDLPIATALPVGVINELAERTKAAATVVVLDCCYSGILKGADPAAAAEGRGRWVLSASRRDQVAADAEGPDGLSPFSRLLAEGLVGGAELDLDEDGFVTVEDLHRYIRPRLEELTGQIPTARWEGSGALAIALAPGYPTEFDQRPDLVRMPDRDAVVLPSIPTATTPVPIEEGSPTSVEHAPMAGEPDKEIVDAMTSAVRQKDEVTLRLSLQQAVRQVGETIDVVGEMQASLDALDLMTCSAGAVLNVGSTDWFTRCIGSLSRAYELGFDARGNLRHAPEGAFRSPHLWLSIFQRALALGALAVRLEDWVGVRVVALQRPEGQDFRHYRTWLRHALTMSARNNLFDIEQDGQRRTTSPIVMAREYSAGHPLALAPDLPGNLDERLLDSLCQFDALAAVAALCDTPTDDTSQFYPNFARFHTTRTEPALVRLLHDAEMRQVLAPVGDDVLAFALAQLNTVARGESRMFDGWWGYDSSEIETFIAANASG